MCLQYGYVTMFAIAFPLSTTIVFINNVLQIQANKLDLLEYSKRPIPKGANDIGFWYYILEFVTFISIFSNIAILVFTSNCFIEIDIFYKLVIFMCVVYFFILLKLVIASVIPDLPEKLNELNKRFENILEKSRGDIPNQDFTPQPTDFEIK